MLRLSFGGLGSEEDGTVCWRTYWPSGMKFVEIVAKTAMPTVRYNKRKRNQSNKDSNVNTLIQCPYQYPLPCILMVTTFPITLVLGLVFMRYLNLNFEEIDIVRLIV